MGDDHPQRSDWDTDDLHPYDPMDTDDGRQAWRRTHANNEQTFVWCEQVNENGVTTVVAADVYQPDLKPIAAECVALATDPESAAEHARRWMSEHGKGIAAGGDGDGWLAKVWGWLRSLDANSASPVAHQQEQQKNN